MDQIAAMKETLKQARERGFPDLSHMEDADYAHFTYMLDSAIDGQVSGEFSEEKIGRWLGYIQGALVAQSIFTLDEVKAINEQFSRDVGPGLVWEYLHPHAGDFLGLLPNIFRRDGGKLVAQANIRYAHGGGWQPMSGWTLLPNKAIEYPGDTALKPCAMAVHGFEVIRVYPHAWVCIENLKDGTYQVARMD